MEKKELIDYDLDVVSLNFFDNYRIEIKKLKTDSSVSYSMWVTIFTDHPTPDVGCFNYASLFEAYADLYRIVVGDLEFIADEEGYITDKIYKYKTE